VAFGASFKPLWSFTLADASAVTNRPHFSQTGTRLRGRCQYKDYVLVLLFIKYVSDKYAGQPFAPITTPEGGSFKDMALKG
jgi:hypothetical protein